MMDLLQPGHLIQTFGVLGVMVVVFAESGLLMGFFLPGDSLLFTAGLLAAGGLLSLPPLLIAVIVLCSLVPVARELRAEGRRAVQEPVT